MNFDRLSSQTMELARDLAEEHIGEIVGEYERLKENFEELKKENESLREEVEELESKLEKLKGKE